MAKNKINHGRTVSYKPSGIMIDLADIKRHQISTDDITVCLGNTYRFCGAIRWSVAAHSALCHNVVKVLNFMPLDARQNYLEGLGLMPCKFIDEMAIHMLLHDCHEAYIGDIISPVANLGIQDFLTDLKARIDKVIYKAFFLPPPCSEMKKYIRIVDKWALQFERNCILKRTGLDPEMVKEFEHKNTVISNDFTNVLTNKPDMPNFDIDLEADNHIYADRFDELIMAQMALGIMRRKK